MMNTNTRKFLQKVVLAVIAIIPGVLGLFIGYNRGQVTTQIKTIEALDGVQSIAADNVTVNYYSGTGNYEDTLDKVITSINTSAQDSQALISLNAQLKQENSTMREENDNLQERVSTLQEELSEKQRDISELRKQISELEKQISIPQDDGTQADDISGNVTDEKAVYLTDACPPYESNRYEAPITMKMMGNTYSNGFQLDAAYSGFALFNIDGKYKTLEFDFGHIDGSTMTNVTYNIYLDGRFLQTIDGTSDMKVAHISIPLNQASQLKIDFSSHSGYPVYGFANATLK